MSFNENTRVKIPAILHLTRLGYEYVSLSNARIDADTNIFTDIFAISLKRLNPSVEDLNHAAVLNELKAMLDYEDLGRSFYERITKESGIRIIDFEDFDRNNFHVVTELPCKNGDDEFRPDITVLINGIPLAFIEVKIPNNKGGIVAESARMNERRMSNKKFRRFLNATQIMVFSNNLKYDAEGGITPIQGAFYATVSNGNIVLNSFHEEDKAIYDNVKSVDTKVEEFILRDNNLVSIKHSDEYAINKAINTPTNRIIVSLFSRERIKMLLKYGIVYVNSDGGKYDKHIMRYPQIFATLAIEQHIKQGFKRGIIWHTQGSGKTALAYFNVPYLTNYFRKQNIVPKFYFIVDRLDLLTQAKGEFADRGLVVMPINSKDDFKKALEAQSAMDNSSGKFEITVVNIQKFENDSRAIESTDYTLNVQRVYFIDEVHRSYNPQGSFLANLIMSDRNAIFIGLTGTPLIKQKYKGTDGKSKDFDSKDIFTDFGEDGKYLHGAYIHKYYYDRSIGDGYTLKLIREGIETQYRLKLNQMLKGLLVEKGAGDVREVYAHHHYVESLTEYIVTDLKLSRERLCDPSIGAMVVCHSGKQARAISNVVKNNYRDYSCALILHDADDSEVLKERCKEFKAGKIDILVVYQMLLTGFDAHRLKKLYLNRAPQDHNLLQTLTRVNRPYKKHRYGFVVDFADIRSAFDKTNAEYLKELQVEIGEEWERYSALFKSKEEIEAEIQEIKENLFYYDTQNKEVFCRQISEIEDKKELLILRRMLENAQTLGNMIKLYDHSDIWDTLDFSTLHVLLRLVEQRIDLLNQREAIESGDDSVNILNIALEDVDFTFIKISEDELTLGLVDRYKQQVAQTREAMLQNFDPHDSVFISLKEELERLFRKKKLEEEKDPKELESDIITLKRIYDEITAQNRRDNMLRAKYNGDKKFTRIHKRLLTPPPYPPEWSKREVSINTALLQVKAETDNAISNRKNVIENEPFFADMLSPIVLKSFRAESLETNTTCLNAIVNLVVKEYVSEFMGVAA